jgi:hypothetical protein
MRSLDVLVGNVPQRDGHTNNWSRRLGESAGQISEWGTVPARGRHEANECLGHLVLGSAESTGTLESIQDVQISHPLHLT